jgi:hypothetical protein
LIRHGFRRIAPSSAAVVMTDLSSRYALATESALVPSGFSAIYVRHIIIDDDGPGMAEFLATTRDGRQFTTTRVTPFPMRDRVSEK